MWIVKATLTLMGTNGATAIFTGLAQEVESENYKQVNFTSALENAETSAVGRACAFAGIGIDSSIASADELTKALNREAQAAQVATNPKLKPTPDIKRQIEHEPPQAFRDKFRGGTDGQIQFLFELLTELDDESHLERTEAEFIAGGRSKSAMSDIIEKYKAFLQHRKDNAPAKVHHKAQLLRLLGNKYITPEEKDRMICSVNKMTVSRIEKAIENLKQTIAERTQAEQTA
jgi:hypothetical protein